MIYKTVIMTLALLAVALFPGWSQNKQMKILYGAAEVMEEIREIPEVNIPPSLLDKAEGLIIVPGVTKVSFVVGGRRGRGIALAKDKNGNWTNPVFVTLTGGSVGFQIGVQSTDVILIFKRRSTLLNMQKGTFTLGADASVAAGPVGRSAAAATDIEFQVEVLSYSRSRGLFAGVSLDGSSLDVWEEGNREYYREFDLTPQQIFADRMGTEKEELKALADALRKAEAYH